MKIILMFFVFYFSFVFASFAQSLDAARTLFLQDDTNGAIRECENLISATNSNELKAQAYYIMGLSLLKQSKPVQARPNFEIIINEFKDSKLAGYAEIGIVDSYFQEGNFQNVCLEYEKILSKYPQAPFKNILYFKLARGLQKLGRWQESKDLFNRIKTEYPLSFEASLSSDILNEGLFYFTVQVGAFNQQNRAEKLCEKLKRKRYNAFISQAIKDDKTYYRVRVGRFNSQEEVDAVAKELKKEDYPVKIYP